MFPWATNHTWESWRNRYKKHKARIDERIEFYVKHIHPPHPDGKGQYPMDRRNKGLFRGYARTRNFEDEEEEEEEEEVGVGIVNDPHELDLGQGIPDNDLVAPAKPDNNPRKRIQGVAGIEDDILELPRQTKRRVVAPRVTSPSASFSGIDVEGSVHK